MRTLPSHITVVSLIKFMVELTIYVRGRGMYLWYSHSISIGGREFQPMKSAHDDSFLLSDQNTDQFLV